MKFFLHDAIVQDDGTVRRISRQEAVVQRGAPYFRDLFVLLQDRQFGPGWRDCPYGSNYLGSGLYEEVVEPWMPQAQTAVGEMAKYRSLSTLGDTYALDSDDQCQWYAFSRVNDLLLADLFAVRPHRILPVSKLDRGTYSNYLATHHDEARYVAYQETHTEAHFATCRKREEQYARFFTELGFSVYYDRPFQPFYHEIVEVIYDDEVPEDQIQVSFIYWPGIMFGEMMFSRAGVQVTCQEGTIDKQIAENSTIYFTYSRPNRRTHDLSQGWGSNSQWRTDFRLDFEDAKAFYFNAQGKYRLGDDYVAMLPSYERDHIDDLTMTERIELLCHRCFVMCSKDDANRLPYSDQYEIPKANSDRTAAEHLT